MSLMRPFTADSASPCGPGALERGMSDLLAPAPVTQSDKTSMSSASVPRKALVRSFGCQMNVYDGQKMADILSAQGYEMTESTDDAALVILNTCHIRERATEKVFTELGKLKETKTARAKDGHETKIVVAGCVAQAEGAEIQRRQPAVDLVVGPQAYHRLPELLQQAKTRRLVDTDFPVDDKFGHLPGPSRAATLARGVSAFVTVQEGCDKFCAFCVVPYTRGAEFSRPVARILDEVRRLTDAGVREITLIGQNVNAYHGQGLDGGSCTLAGLLQAVAEVPGVLRLRYTTSHPRDMGEDLIAAHRDLAQLMPFLHLPVQSGADRTLAAMNRQHKGDDYRRLIERIRTARPDIALSSDFIVGFPGESEADFRETLRLCEDIRFASAFTFKYSERPGTPAANAPDQVPETERHARLLELQALVETHRQDFNHATVGRETEVLVEREGRMPGQMAGKSPWLQPVQFDTTERRIGDTVKVRIDRAGSNSLFGQLAASAPAMAQGSDRAW